MDTKHIASARTVEVRLDTRGIIAALWTATTFCYMYADVHSLFRADIFEQIPTGTVSGFPINQVSLLLSSILMAVPILMIVASLLLPRGANRIANIIVAAAHIPLAIVTATLSDPWLYYIFFSALEIVLLLLIIVYAFRWPEDQYDLGVTS